MSRSHCLTPCAGVKRRNPVFTPDDYPPKLEVQRGKDERQYRRPEKEDSALNPKVRTSETGNWFVRDRTLRFLEGAYGFLNPMVFFIKPRLKLICKNLLILIVLITFQWTRRWIVQLVSATFSGMPCASKKQEGMENWENIHIFTDLRIWETPARVNRYSIWSVHR
jgi:hypothetical protein